MIQQQRQSIGRWLLLLWLATLLISPWICEHDHGHSVAEQDCAVCLLNATPFSSETSDVTVSLEVWSTPSLQPSYTLEPPRSVKLLRQSPSHSPPA